MNDPEPTAELLAAIKAGDEAAFERLFRAWYPRLADYAHRMLQDRDKAEDAVQEVLVALWHGRASPPAASALPGYLHRAVRNRALNQVRGKRANQIDIDSVAPIGVDPTALIQLEDEELAMAVNAALGTLAPRTREVFLLSREQNLSYREIADTLEISVKTVETLMGRALKQLRAQLLASDS